MNSGTKVVFFGNEKLASGIKESGIILRSLIEAGYEVTSLFINLHDSRNKVPEVMEIAEKNNISIFQTWNEEKVINAAKDADVGVLAAYGKIIPERVIASFRCGIVNIHPSLLPKYRGSTPIETAILNNDRTTGVSIMALSKKMDAGKIYGSSEIRIDDGTSKQELYEALSKEGTELLLHLLPSIVSGDSLGLEQNEEDATYTKMLSKEDSYIDWSLPAKDIHRQIVAYDGWPGSKTELFNKAVTIEKAEPMEGDGAPGSSSVIERYPVVYCGVDALRILTLKPDGRKSMDGKSFANGLKN